MKVTEKLVLSALNDLTEDEKQKVFNSKSKRDSRTALTKFATSLVVKVVAREYPGKASLTVYASFKGSKSGRSKGGAGGLKELGSFAARACRSEEMKFVEEECLVDFLVVAARPGDSKPDRLIVRMTAESEAEPMPLMPSALRRAA